MKETFYFSHDYHARSDTKIVKLLQKEKLEWYGIFWSIVEMLYENDGYIEKDYETIAFELRTECERIASVVENYWLFIFEWNNITSKSVLARLSQRREKSKLAQKSAKARWWKEKQGDANALRTQSDGNAIKESKGKERKVNENTNTEIVSIETKKTENEIFFETIQTDTDSIIDSMNIPEEQYENARRELFKFWNYWTEKDMRGKERWRKEKTFEVKRRLTTWLMNNKFNSNQSPYVKKPRVVG